MSRSVLVIPCFNEAARLPADDILRFIRASTEPDLLFVDDGSTDDTGEVLQKLQRAEPQRVSTTSMPRNSGKGAAVRQGCLSALAAGCDFIGYWDADLATPLDAFADFQTVFRQHPEVEAVFGARIQLLGRSIRRRALRHYLGRVFATAASLALGLAVYDTQCGAKLFRATPRIRAVFDEPFQCRWLFDVEILARLIRNQRLSGGPEVSQLVYELPLKQWHDVAGSKVKPADFPRALGELLRIRRRYLVGLPSAPR
jgi:glycosyltransferase involved in cell wall biosynthesis